MTEILLFVLALSLLGALLLRELAHAKERRDLYDRLQAPGAAQAAATERFLPKMEPRDVPEDPPFPIHDPDLRFLENA